VADLVADFETPFGLKLLAKVHWVIRNDPVETTQDIVARTYAWNNRKKRFSQRRIVLAVDVLGKKGWIDHPVRHGR
jgi:hypothetical protein